MSNFWGIPPHLRSKALARAMGVSDQAFEEAEAAYRAHLGRGAPLCTPPAVEAKKPEPTVRPAMRVRYYNPHAIQWLY